MTTFFKIKTTEADFQVLEVSETSKDIKSDEWCTDKKNGWIGPWDMTLELANKVADALTDNGTPTLFVDRGDSVSPRYSVCSAPVIGAPVSTAFNGDMSPAGTIVKVSKSYRRVQTSDGTLFYRKKQSAVWLSNGTWGMVHGHHTKRNPSF